MGRTIPSYRIASEMKRWKWRPFRKLLDKEDRKIFDEMLNWIEDFNKRLADAESNQSKEELDLETELLDAGWLIEQNKNERNS